MTRLTYRAPFAQHVLGTYDERQIDPETRQHERQRIDIVCQKCGQTFTTYCYSGRPREKVSRFALDHLHGDPFAVRNPGSR